MAVISVITTQNIKLEYELASLGERMVATIIDLVILAAYIIAVGLFSDLSGAFRNNSFIWLYVVLFLPVAFYSLLSETLLNGQSVGKRVMGIKVISLNGNQPSFGQYLIRWLFRLIDLWTGSFIIATVTIAVTEKHQRLGDMVAGTTVIKLKPRTALHQTLYMPVAAETYQPAYPEIINLSDSDMQLIKEVLITVQKSGNTMLALQTAEKIESLLHIKSHHADAVSFLHTLLSDYNHLTVKM